MTVAHLSAMPALHRVCPREAKQLAGNYGFDPLYLAAKDEETFKW